MSSALKHVSVAIGATLVAAISVVGQEAQHQHPMPAPGAQDPATDLRITRVTPGIEQFKGGIAYDSASGRLWLLSYGPPSNTRGPSTLYEVDPKTGAVLAQARMPFLGEFGAPSYADGFLYVGVPHESQLYKVDTGRDALGVIVKKTPLPTLNDIPVRTDEPFRFPFINFPGVSVTPDKRLLYHADDLGLLVTVEPETGRVVKQVPTLRGLASAIAVPGRDRPYFVLGNADPELTLLKRDQRVFMFRSAHGFTPPYAIRTETPCKRVEARDLSWALVDPETGEVLASAIDRCARTTAGSIALIDHMPTPSGYGRYRFLATGEEGILTIEWTPR